jgi:hypothetical protein
VLAAATSVARSAAKLRSQRDEGAARYADEVKALDVEARDEVVQVLGDRARLWSSDRLAMLFPQPRRSTR